LPILLGEDRAELIFVVALGVTLPFISLAENHSARNNGRSSRQGLQRYAETKMI